MAKDLMLTGKKIPYISYKESFKKALKVMNQKKLGIIVLRKGNYIFGIVTDGDLRRELKNYKTKELQDFASINPLMVNENMSASKVLAIMNDKKITSMLVVSDKDYEKKNKILKGVIHIHTLLQNEV